jgi:hypothetical protein
MLDSLVANLLDSMRFNLLVLSTLIGIVLAMVFTLFVFGYLEREKLRETDQQKNIRWAHKISTQCLTIAPEAINSVLKSCESAVDRCNGEFSKLEKNLVLITQSSPDSSCAKVMDLYLEETFNRIDSKFEQMELKSPFEIGWTKIKKIALRLWFGKNVKIPSPSEIDQEFRRIQRAMGVPETGAPPWGNRAPPQKQHKESFKSVGESISEGALENN